MWYIYWLQKPTKVGGGGWNGQLTLPYMFIEVDDIVGMLFKYSYLLNDYDAFVNTSLLLIVLQTGTKLIN